MDGAIRTGPVEQVLDACHDARVRLRDALDDPAVTDTCDAAVLRHVLRAWTDHTDRVARRVRALDRHLPDPDPGARP